MLVRSVYSDAVWKCKCTFYSLFTCKQAIMMVTSSYSYDSWHIFGLKQSKTKVSQRLLRHPLFVIPLQTCTEIVLLMYRLHTEIVLSMYRSCIGRIAIYRTWHHLYRNWHVPRSSTLCAKSVMYRYGPYPVAYPGDNPNLLSDALCVYDNVTERVYSYTLFGIVIQCNLKWNAHCTCWSNLC